jgi:hypothetical protein
VTSCGECGFVYEELRVERVADTLRAFGPSYRDALADVDAQLAAERIEPTVWSALEYAAHLRDVFLVQRERVVLARVVERPSLAPMSRDERVELCRYASQPLEDVLGQLAMAADLCALVFEGLAPSDWDSEVIYNWPTTAVRDLRWVGRNTVHEGTHHLGDVRRVLAAARRA